MNRAATWRTLALLATTAVTWSGVAAAQRPSISTEVKRCAAAYEEAQRRQGRGELLAAREQAGVCAAQTCPAEIVDYCAKLAEELDASIPSIVVALTDARGRDVDAKVIVDDRELQAHIDGRPVRLDPGRHHLKLVPATPGASPVELDLTLRSGEQNRRVEARIESPAPPPAPPPAPDANPSFGYAPSIVAFAIGGLGLAVGATTGIMALSQDSELADACDTNTSTCTPEHEAEIDRAETLGYASTIGFVLGGVGVATGVILAIVAASSEREAPVERTRTGYRIRF